MKTILSKKYAENKDNLEQRLEDFFEKMGPLNEWWSKNKPKEEISNVFNNLTQIKDFKILKSNPRSGRFAHEPNDGTINYNGKVYDFKFSHEFDEGNSYIVYDNNNPVFYFLLYNDFEGDIGSPMLFEQR